MKLKNLFSRKADPVQPSADQWFQRGNAHVSQQQWQPALECYREAARLDPTHAMAHAFVGNVLRQLRDPDAAMAAYDRAITVKPDYAEVHFNRGVLLQQSRQVRAALASFDTALSINSSFPEAYCSRGDVLRELGRLEEAVASYSAAISLNQGYAKAYLNRGIVEQLLHRPAMAEASYRQAIALKSDYADAYVNLGALQSDAGSHADALMSFDAAIALAPEHNDAHAGRGLALMTLGQTVAALASFDKAIRLKPDFARVFGNRAHAQAKLGRLAEARSSHDQAALLDPRDAAIHFNRGIFLSDRREWNDAIQSYQAAISLTPGHAEAYCCLGTAQHEAGLGDAALDSYSRALAINPKLVTALINRGNLFRFRRQFTESLLDLRQALALEPNSVEGHYNIGLLALLQGNLAAGWPEYEWRRLTEEASAATARELPQPAWFGDQSLKNKQIFLHAEQGLGDTIQFSRYASLVAALGARVILEVQPTLGELLANLNGVAELVLLGSPVPPADYQCSLMSLPGAFKTTLETIPRAVPYLYADPLKVTRCRQTLGPGLRKRVGLAWSGNPRQSSNHTRSVPLATLIANLPEEFEYFCLQNQMSDIDRQTLRSAANIRTIESLLETLSDTAALIETLDLVISVDTSLAHLSAAMGKNTWILLPYFPDWRWLINRRDSPWYPTATLYRQPAANDWEGALAEVREDLLLEIR